MFLLVTHPRSSQDWLDLLVQRYKYSSSLHTNGPTWKCHPQLSSFSGGLGQIYLSRTWPDPTPLLTLRFPNLTSHLPISVAWESNGSLSHNFSSTVCFRGTKLTVLWMCLLKLWVQVLILIQTVWLGKLFKLSLYFFIYKRDLISPCLIR